MLISLLIVNLMMGKRFVASSNPAWLGFYILKNQSYHLTFPECYAYGYNTMG